MTLKITDNSIISRNPNLVFNEIDGEVVMMSSDATEYFSLNDVGSSIWNHLECPLSVKTLLDKLMSEYTVSNETCESDTVPFLLDLIELEVLQLNS